MVSFPLPRLGVITVEDVLQALPFRNDIMSVELEGRYILEMLEHSVKDYNPGELDGKFLQMSGTLIMHVHTLLSNSEICLFSHIFVHLFIFLCSLCFCHNLSLLSPSLTI